MKSSTNNNQADIVSSNIIDWFQNANYKKLKKVASEAKKYNAVDILKKTAPFSFNATNIKAIKVKHQITYDLVRVVIEQQLHKRQIDNSTDALPLFCIELISEPDSSFCDFVKSPLFVETILFNQAIRKESFIRNDFIALAKLNPLAAAVIYSTDLYKNRLAFKPEDRRVNNNQTDIQQLQTHYGYNNNVDGPDFEVFCLEKFVLQEAKFNDENDFRQFIAKYKKFFPRFNQKTMMKLLEEAGIHAALAFIELKPPNQHFVEGLKLFIKSPLLSNNEEKDSVSKKLKELNNKSAEDSTISITEKILTNKYLIKSMLTSKESRLELVYLSSQTGNLDDLIKFINNHYKDLKMTGDEVCQLLFKLCEDGRLNSSETVKNLLSQYSSKRGKIFLTTVRSEFKRAIFAKINQPSDADKKLLQTILTNPCLIKEILANKSLKSARAKLSKLMSLEHLNLQTKLSIMQSDAWKLIVTGTSDSHLNKWDKINAKFGKALPGKIQAKVWLKLISDSSSEEIISEIDELCFSSRDDVEELLSEINGTVELVQLCIKYPKLKRQLFNYHFEQFQRLLLNADDLHKENFTSDYNQTLLLLWKEYLDARQHDDCKILVTLNKGDARSELFIELDHYCTKKNYNHLILSFSPSYEEQTTLSDEQRNLLRKLFRQSSPLIVNSIFGNPEIYGTNNIAPNELLEFIKLSRPPVIADALVVNNWLRNYLINLLDKGINQAVVYDLTTNIREYCKKLNNSQFDDPRIQAVTTNMKNIKCHAGISIENNKHGFLHRSSSTATRFNCITANSKPDLANENNPSPG